jgi:cytochrome c biogenesis protein
VIAFLRNTWRGLTSMRTALVLLFLLALAALPGALLPQRSLNSPKVDDYIASHGWWGQLLNRLEFYNVYGSVWFSAVYLLLFISLVGCLLPRSLDYVKALRAKPVITPRNLSRLPHHHETTVDATPAQVMDTAKQRLKGWRLAEREEEDGSRSISAERGYLRETGNLVFHFAMLGLIVALALGKMFNYEGQVIVMANGSQYCNISASTRSVPASVSTAPTWTRSASRSTTSPRTSCPPARPTTTAPTSSTSPARTSTPTRGGPTSSRSTRRCAPPATASTC